MIDRLLAALHHNAGDDVAWLALADALEEADDPRAEMTRLTVFLRRNLDGRAAREARLLRLLADGMRPCVPTATASHGLALTLVPPGVFLMGAKRGESHADRSERPRHEVEITRPFYLGTYPVTQGQYEAVTGDNPSTFRPNPGSNYNVPVASTADFPADMVDEDAAVAFCAALSALPAERDAGRVYRLPSEAEWEYACRAGTQTIFAFGDTLDATQANFDGNFAYGVERQEEPPSDAWGIGPNYLHRTSAVGSYAPNAFGLYDMHGNVCEWCADWYVGGYYQRSPREDPPGPPRRSRGRGRVLRGGSWIDGGWSCRSAARSDGEALHYVGFRVACGVDG